MLLAIDTSTAQIGLALHDGTVISGELAWLSRAHHTEQLAPGLAELLKRIGTGMEAVKAVAVAIGPGSFTALRVGLAFAKGLALARHIPIFGIPTLDITAAAVPLSERTLIAVLQAGRRHLAAAWYRPSAEGWQPEGPAVSLSAGDLEAMIRKPVIICGELSAEDRQTLGRKYRTVQLASPAQCVRRPGVLAEIAWERWRAGRLDTAASLAPIYLHTVAGPPG
jgi:tRNA threonylcarbamoyladenosine biosynthesis protein TsaB